ncbi:MAG: hypothetical protein E6G03_08655 [Actinobacteria bacterium]|nr:MAG: hypothetical protein E6G03_08655 [Actinomycetota bacterium]
MAKKVRTPPPPRKVQVPQRRDTRKAPAAAAAQRSPWLYAAGGALAVALVAAAVLGIVLTRGGSSSAKSPTAGASYNALPGIRKTKAPWPPEYLYLADRLAPLDLTTLAGHNGLVLHFHAHLDIFVNGKHITVPALVGINSGAGYLTELHTHDARGVIHIEAQKARSFTLGQFFAEWAVFLNAHSIGGYSGMTWYLDGKLQTGNPQNLVFKPHQEIAIVVGKPPAKIPSSYKFLPGE